MSNEVWSNWQAKEWRWQLRVVVSSLKPLALKHQIFILDANLLGHLNEKTYRESTQNLMNHLLQALKMKKLGPLQVFPAEDKRAPGWSFIQPITTSHVSGHYFEKPGRFPHIHIDIYSCCFFRWQNIIDVLDQHLQLKDWSANFIKRHTRLGHRKIIGLAGKGKTIKKMKALP